MKKVALTLLIVGVVCAGSMIMAPTNNAHAAGVWAYCHIDGTGVSGTATTIRMTENTTPTPAFSKVWFTLDPTRSKEMLAQALTAMLNNQRVMVNLASYGSGATVLGLWTYSD